jgi:hypothetical protein
VAEHNTKVIGHCQTEETMAETADGKLDPAGRLVKKDDYCPEPTAAFQKGRLE